ncbi:MAG: hypothetical protein CMO35_05750 [Verrucomicrobiaceae bacterium]|jgi:hypothetical protein|nr:hypothetical protein [Verrucomicrobiaceae bacterium]
MKHFLILLLVLSPARTPAEGVSFSREVAPLLQRHCVGCHKEGKAKGKYRLDTYEELRKELEPGDLESELLFRLTTEDEEERMPAEADPLPPAEIDVIRKWVKEGANYDGGDPKAPLSSVIPVKDHPSSPPSYPRPLGVTAMVFGTNGEKLYTGGYHEILVWNPEDGSLLGRIPNNGQRTYGLSLSPDGKQVAAATGAPGRAGEVRVFQTGSGEILATPFRGDDTILTVAYGRSGNRLAFGGVDGKLRIVETDTWRESLVVSSHSDWLTAVRWHPDGKQVATASRDKTAKVYDVTSGKRISTFSGHPESVRAVDFHSNGREVLSSGDHGHLFLWRIEDGRKIADRAKFEGPILRLLHGGNGLFVSAPGGVVVQFNPEDHKRLREFKIEPPEGTEVPIISSLAAHGRWLAVGTLKGKVAVFDTESGERRMIFLAKP